MIKKINTTKAKTIKPSVTKSSTRVKTKASKPVVSNTKNKKIITPKKEQVKPKSEVIKKVNTKKEVTKPIKKKPVAKKTEVKPVTTTKKVKPTAIKQSPTKAISKKTQSIAKPITSPKKKSTKKTELKPVTESKIKDDISITVPDEVEKFITSYVINTENILESLDASELKKLKDVAITLSKTKSEFLTSLYKDFTSSVAKIGAITKSSKSAVIVTIHNIFLSERYMTFNKAVSKEWSWDTLKKYFEESPEWTVTHLSDYLNIHAKDN